MADPRVNTHPCSAKEGCGSHTDTKKKKEILEELFQLQVKFNTVERERSRHLYSKHHEFQTLFCTLEETETKLTKQRNTEGYELKQQIEKIRSNVAHFKRTLHEGKSGSSFVEKVKQTLEDIEASLLTFKEKQKDIYEQLLREENIVLQEISAYERRIESWLTSKSDKTGSHVTSGVVKSVETISMPSEVVAFERFLVQTGGHNGGWDEYDHQIFLKIRNKHHAGPSFLDIAVTEIPTHTPEDIEQHEHWYIEYCTLLDSKKKAIVKWKKDKENERLQMKTGIKDEMKESQSKRNKLLEKEQHERFSKLSDWKMQKMRLQSEEEERRLKLEKEKSIKQRKREMERQSVVKAQIEEYSRRKEEERKVKQLEDEARAIEAIDKCRIANKQIQKFQQRDTHSLHEKMERLSLQEQEEMEKRARLEKLKQTVTVKVSRDPARLLQLTAGWKERKKADPEIVFSGSLLNIPKRAVPTWRQGL